MPANPESKPTGPRVVNERRKVAQLKDDPRNARRHSEAQIAKIAASIAEFGYVAPIIIRPDDQIIAGHATRDATVREGHVEVDVHVVYGLSAAQYQKLAIALNRLPEDSDWNEDVLAEIFRGLKDEEEDPTGTGFSLAEVDKLLNEPDALEVKEIETGPVDDEFWISVRGPLKHQAAALKALEQAMKPFDGVDVDLGTINIG